MSGVVGNYRRHVFSCRGSNLFLSTEYMVENHQFWKVGVVRLNLYFHIKTINVNINETVIKLKNNTCDCTCTQFICLHLPERLRLCSWGSEKLFTFFMVSILRKKFRAERFRKFVFNCNLTGVSVKTPKTNDLKTVKEYKCVWTMNILSLLLNLHWFACKTCTVYGCRIPWFNI